MQCLLLSSKNTHWVSLNGMNSGLLPSKPTKLEFAYRRKACLVVNVYQPAGSKSSLPVVNVYRAPSVYLQADNSTTISAILGEAVEGTRTFALQL